MPDHPGLDIRGDWLRQAAGASSRDAQLVFTTDNRKEMRTESDGYVGPKVAFRKVGELASPFGVMAARPAFELGGSVRIRGGHDNAAT